MLGVALLPPCDSDDDMPEYVRDELLRHLEVLRQEMHRGFDGVNERLDKQNGRIGKLEAHQAADFARIQALERERESESPEGPSRGRTALTLTLGGGLGAGIVEIVKALLRMHG